MASRRASRRLRPPALPILPMATGCAAAVAWSYGLGRVGTRMALVGLGVAALCVLAMGRNGVLEQVTFLAFRSPLFPIACALVIVYLASVPAGIGARLLSLGPLRYIGVISYGLYLWHFPLMHLAGVRAGLILTVGAAAFSYRYVEMPIRRAGAARRVSRTDAEPAGFPRHGSPLVLAERPEQA